MDNINLHDWTLFEDFDLSVTGAIDDSEQRYQNLVDAYKRRSCSHSFVREALRQTNNLASLKARIRGRVSELPLTFDTAQVYNGDPMLASTYAGMYDNTHSLRAVRIDGGIAVVLQLEHRWTDADGWSVRSVLLARRSGAGLQIRRLYLMEHP